MALAREEIHLIQQENLLEQLAQLESFGPEIYDNSPQPMLATFKTRHENRNLRNQQKRRTICPTIL
jgi:hypothetical protein